MIQRLYSVNFLGKTYNLFALSEKDAIRKAKELHESEEHDEYTEELENRGVTD